MNDRVPTGPGGHGNLPAPARSGGVYAPAVESLESDEIDLRDIFMTLRRRRRTILFTLLSIVTAVAAWTWLTTPTWRASTLIRVDEQESGAPIPLLDALTALQGGSQIETEMRILGTRPVAEQVVDELDLNLRVTNPRDVPRESLFADLELGRETVKGRYSIRPLDAGRYRLVSAGDDTPALRLEFSAGERVEIPGGSFVLARGASVGHVEFETLMFQKAVEKLVETTSISRPDREANVLEVAYRTADRVLVYQVPNAVAESFITLRIDDQKTDARSTVSFLEDQVEETRRQLEAAETELQDFREGEQIVALEAEAVSQVQRLATLQTQRVELDAERSALAELIGSVEGGDAPPDYRRLASFPSFFRNSAIASILVKLIEADEERTELLVRVTPSHPDLVGVQTRIDDLEAQLGSIGRNYLAALSDQIAALDAVLTRFGADLERIPEREIQFARLDRQMEMLAELFTLMQTRLKEAEVAEAIDDSSVRIVERAIEPLEPVSPRPARNFVLAVFFGLVLGTIIAFLREYMDRRLHSSDRIEALYGLPTMARIPGLALGNGRAGTGGALVALEDAQSVGAESFRNLRTNVRFVRSGRGANEIVITSPSPGEGKSLTAANLAVTLAQKGRSALLIDADMRRPVQHRQFMVEQSPGLSDCLLADTLLEGVIRPTMLDTLFILPAGGQPPNPAELLDSPQMNRLLEALRGRYDAIILDSPPILAVTDSAVLGPKTDGIILVVRAEKSDKDAIALAIHQMRQVDAEILGVVVNDARAEGLYQSYYREYYGPARSTGLRGLIHRIQGAFS
jgi:tyrosine-protein kinase Etk/Wzc